VADTGIGIPSADIGRIFERFYRVDKGRSRAMGGTGLGLAIVRHVVEAHGEKVQVHSKLAEGTTFSLSFTRI
jgi:two-component system, OmpR family, phosphate regulon sensor histidine kinase PhoR